MENYEILKMLFETHHSQLVERRQKIHAITERTIGIMVVCAGWLILGDTLPSRPLRFMLIAPIIVIALTACKLQYGHNKTYIEICRVVKNLNIAFGLFEEGKYIPDEAIYPEAWKLFGMQSNWKMLSHHWTAIVIMAIICIFSALSR